MATANFPTGAPAIYTADPDEPLAVQHPALHETITKEQKATDDKLGYGSSTPTNVDDVLYVSSAGNTAYGKRGLVKIAEASGTGSSGVITFSAIPATYRSLEIEVYGRSDNASTQLTLQVTFESSPTSGAYDYGLLYPSNTTPTAGQAIGSPDYIFGGFFPGSSSTASLYATSRIWLPEYAKTSNWKPVQIISNGVSSLGSGLLSPALVGGVFEQAAAIATVKLTISAGNWTTDSRATLWGKAA